MTHNSSLGSQILPEEVRDIRGASIRGGDGTKLGDVIDVMVDHETMEVRYLVVDSSGWLDTRTFLLAADRISADENDNNNLAADVTRRQIENSPQYHDRAQQSPDEWKKYEQEFKQYWDEEPVMHMKDSYRIITPEAAPPARRSARTDTQGSKTDDQIDAAKLFPERISQVFSDPAPNSGKVTLRPKSAARAEEAASGLNMLKPHWWEAFENYLRINKEDIKAKCPECSSKAA